METPVEQPKVPIKTMNTPYEVKLNNYVWDQSQKFVKFYIILPKVNTVPSENIQCDFKEKSLDFKVKNLGNKDYLFKITQLLHCIEPKDSRYKVKHDLILINAAKKEDICWSHVTELEKKSSESKKNPSFDSDDKSDPSSSLTNFMKNRHHNPHYRGNVHSNERTLTVIY